MSNAKLVRFEEVTPTLLRVAFFDGHLTSLISHLKLPIYGGYDDLEEMVFAFLTLPSGKTVVLGEYVNSPRTGVDLYVDSKLVGIPVAIYESCQQLGMPKNQVVWFRDKFQAEIDSLFAEEGDVQPSEKVTGLETQSIIYDPISCFQHSLEIYTREDFPEYWAMLQHNLGLAYADRTQGDRRENLEKSIECFNKSLKIYNHADFPEKWQINQEDLKTSQLLLKKNLIQQILNRDVSGTNLINVNLSYAILSDANLSHANLSYAILSDATLRDANLSHANLSHADLSGANLSDANLSHSDLSDAILSDANLSHADLRDADLSKANLSEADLSHADLSKANLSDADLSCADLIHTDLSDANLTRADLSQCDLSHTDLDDANLTCADLNYTDLRDVKVTKTQFQFSRGISELMKQDLRYRGAIFEDSPGDRSESTTPVQR